jgi:hypothetical protein
MFFLIDRKRNIIFGWCAKSGCSHIKNIFWYLTDTKTTKLHPYSAQAKLPPDSHKFTIIMVFRNPYDRLVSGFLNKYKKGGQFRGSWRNGVLTFSKFVDTLIQEDFKQIDHHHFGRQTSEAFDESQIFKSKEVRVFDLKNINYEFIEKIYQRKIPREILDFRGDHIRKDNSIVFEVDAFDVNIDEIGDRKVKYSQFYNKEILAKVEKYFENDIIFMLKHGLDCAHPDISG